METIVRPAQNHQLSPLMDRYFKLIAPSVVPMTQAHYHRGLSEFDVYLNGKAIADVNAKFIADWLYYCRDVLEWSNSHTVDVKLAVRRFFSWAVEEEMLVRDPFNAKHLPKLVVTTPERKIFTVEQYLRVLTQARKYPRNYWYPATVIGYWTGLRMGDVAQLEKTEIDLENESFHLLPQKTKRFGKYVDVPIEPEVMEVLKPLLEKPKYPKSRYLIADMALNYQADHGSSVGSQFRWLCQKAGLPDHHFHCFRHTMVSRLINAGVDSVLISKLVGMAIDEIATYAHITLDAKRDAMFKARMSLQNKNKPQ